MRLIHYSDAPLTSVYSVQQSGEKYEWHDGRKPYGLWVSVEGNDDWREWCKAEDFRDVDAQHATEVILAPENTVLIIGSSNALSSFHREYGVSRDRFGKWREERVDWPRVAIKHQGIIIAPYQWAHRLAEPCTGWYITWDCASGCIWDAAAVSKLNDLKLHHQGRREHA